MKVKRPSVTFAVANHSSFEFRIPKVKRVVSISIYMNFICLYNKIVENAAVSCVMPFSQCFVS